MKHSFLACFIMLTAACQSPIEKKSSPVYLHHFDGTEFVPADSLQYPHDTAFLVENTLYLFIGQSDSIVYFSERNSHIPLPQKLSSSLPATPFQSLLQNHNDLLRAAAANSIASQACLDSLLSLYEQKIIPFARYKHGRDSIHQDGNLRDSLLRSATIKLLDRQDLHTTIIPAYLLTSMHAGRKLFDIEKDLAYYQQVEQNYQALSTRTSAQSAFQAYVNVFADYISEKKERDAQFLPGREFPRLLLPDTRGQYISSQDVCRNTPYTLILLVRNACSRCHEERNFLRARIEKYQYLGIYEISVEENGFEAWSENVRKNFTYPWAQVMDTATGTRKSMSRFGLQSTPAAFLLDTNHRIVIRDPSPYFLDSLFKI